MKHMIACDRKKQRAARRRCAASRCRDSKAKCRCKGKTAATARRCRRKPLRTRAVHLSPEIKLPPSPPPTVQVPAPIVQIPAPVVNVPAPNVQVLPAPPAAQPTSTAALRQALESYIDNPLGIEVFTAQSGSQQGTINRSGILRAIQQDGLAVIEPNQAIEGEFLFFPLNQIIGFHYPFYQQA